MVTSVGSPGSPSGTPSLSASTCRAARHEKSFADTLGATPAAYHAVPSISAPTAVSGPVALGPAGAAEPRPGLVGAGPERMRRHGVVRGMDDRQPGQIAAGEPRRQRVRRGVVEPIGRDRAVERQAIAATRLARLRRLA